MEGNALWVHVGEGCVGSLCELGGGRGSRVFGVTKGWGEGGDLECNGVTLWVPGGGGHRDRFVWGGGEGALRGSYETPGGGDSIPSPPHPPAQPSPPPTQPNPTQPGPPAASPPEPGEGIPRLSPPPRRLDGAGQGRCQAGRAGRTGSEPGGGGAARWGLPGARWDARARTFVRSGVRTHAA